jgi:cephalosporin-C deacetylase
LRYRSTNGVKIGGWMLLPIDQPPVRAFVIGHGYGGRDAPDLHLPFPDAALFFPCCRGLSRSAMAPISQDPYWHVRHDVDKKEHYIIRGCVEDIWLMVSVIERYLPAVVGRIGYLGISFGGGVGILALAQDQRIARAHVNVPTFGDRHLRLRLPTTGSGRSLQDFFKVDPYTLIRTLRFYDAANAVARISVPMHFALALRDAVVTPPGQFAIYNQCNSEKQLFLLDAGHESYPNQEQQADQLLRELAGFFASM